MKILKWISIYIGIIIVIFCMFFSLSRIFSEGWIIYANKEYDNIEKLNYKLEKDNIRYMKQDTLKKFLEENNIEIPENSIIQKITCTKALSNGYNINISYLYSDKEYKCSKLDTYDMANYIMINGYQYKDNTLDKIKISVIIISVYAILELIIIKMIKRKK